MTDPSKEFLRRLQATFRVEAEEHLSAIVSSVVQLEQAGDGRQTETLQAILGRLHTLKGAARAVGLSPMEALCHAMESVFSALRASVASLASTQFDLLHQAGTLASQLLDQPSGRTRNQAALLTNRLNQLSLEIAGRGEQGQAESPEPLADAAQFASGEEPGPEELDGDADAANTATVPATAAGQAVMRDGFVRVQSRSLDAIRYQAEELLLVELSLQHHITDMLELADELAGQRQQWQAVGNPVHQRGARRKAAAGAGRAVATALPAGREAANDIERRCRRAATALTRTRKHFVATRNKLMDAMLETALVPFSSALDQLPGLVRNLARSRGKQAQLHIHDARVQIDRRVLDVVRETLIHLVTNAVDHGIENAQQRQERGKPPAGAITINVASGGGDRVSVTVSDDGAGMDIDAITEAAVRDGSLNEDQVAGLDDRQRLHLALQPGISTADELTPVSGRGIGLAIVEEKLTAVGGALSVNNAPGAGCTFTLLLPVRLSTLRGLILQVRGSRFVFPLSGLEFVRALDDGDIRTIESRETLLHAGRVVPVVRLGQLLGIARSPVAESDSERTAVIARAASGTFAMLVDGILSEQEVLPKGLGKQLRRVRYISGATQLGDGSLVPILGLDDIARHGLVAGGIAHADADMQAARDSARRLLVVEDSITSRLLLKHILEGAGYHVETAVDGLDALSRLRQGSFDAVVSDIEMPQMDGLALTERLRANPATEELPVILVTSLHSAEEKERGLRAGADAYVVKGSFDQDNLLKTIRRLI